MGVSVLHVDSGISGQFLSVQSLHPFNNHVISLSRRRLLLSLERLSNELPKVPISWTLFSENLYCHCLGEEGLSYLTTPILSAYLASAELLLPLLKFVIDGAANQTILDSMLSIPTIQAFSTSAFLSHMPTPLHPLALLISSLAITPRSPPPSLPTS